MTALPQDLLVSCRDGQWMARFGKQEWRCAIGRGGVKAAKVEGDGATPVGAFPLRYLLYRADRIEQPKSKLAATAITPADGWCDDPEDPAYNRPVKLPFPARHERLWREDELYDLLVVLGHNDEPPLPGAGSAIFLHVARPDYGPTEGCVALARSDLLSFLKEAGTQSRVLVEAEGA